MRLDALARLVETADFASFRELAAHCLALKGYSEVALTDGWNDGGTDLRVYQLPPNPTHIGFQVTVERDWKAKLWEDAAKAKARLSLDHMTLVTSRRVPEAEFFAESEAVWRDLGVRVTKLDGQAIASTFFLEGRSSLVLRLLGIDVADTATDRPASARENAAYSYAFFGADTHTFRETAIESTIVAIAAARTGIARDALENEVSTLVGLSGSRRSVVVASVDRMIQRGDLSGPAASLTLSSGLADAASAMTTLRQRDWRQLESDVREVLKAGGVRPTQARIDEIVSDLGALLLDAAQNAVSALGSRESSVVSRAKQRLRHLHATLDSIGLPDGNARDRALEELTRIASASAAGKCLLAGELFLSLVPLTTPNLIRALGARSEVVVLLDASVAIPMLCALLFSPVKSRFSLAAHHAYKEISSHGLRLRLPVDYLEESAAHLLRAYHDYRDIIDLDSDLTASENAFVSHYASRRLDGAVIGFAEFLESFGLNEALRKAEFFAALDTLKQRLQRLFSHYSIDALPLGEPSQTSRRRAEEAVAYALRTLQVERPDVLARHDARTLAYLFDTDRSAEVAYVFCTWDGLHFHVREHESAEWLALNPGVCGDILALASDDPAALASPVVLAKSLSEEATERGARVWDQLVRLERGALGDAELLATARNFKEAYLEQAQGGKQAEDLRRAWAAWKAKHYVQPAVAPDATTQPAPDSAQPKSDP